MKNLKKILITTIILFNSILYSRILFSGFRNTQPDHIENTFVPARVDTPTTCISASVLPVYTYNNKKYVILTREARGKPMDQGGQKFTYDDFSGKCEKSDQYDALLSAAREFHEEGNLKRSLGWNLEQTIDFIKKNTSQVIIYEKAIDPNLPNSIDIKNVTYIVNFDKYARSLFHYFYPSLKKEKEYYIGKGKNPDRQVTTEKDKIAAVLWSDLENAIKEQSNTNITSPIQIPALVRDEQTSKLNQETVPLRPFLAIKLHSYFLNHPHSISKKDTKIQYYHSNLNPNNSSAPIQPSIQTPSIQKKPIIITDFDKVWINPSGLIHALSRLQPMQSLLRGKTANENNGCEKEQIKLESFTLKMLDYARCHPTLEPYMPEIIEHYGKSRCINLPIHNLYNSLKKQGYHIIIATNKNRLMYDLAIEGLGNEIHDMVDKIFVSEFQIDQGAIDRLQTFANKSKYANFKEIVNKAINTPPTEKILHVPSKKPFQEYFDYVIEQIGPENDMIFVDDNAKNIEAFNNTQRNSRYLRKGIIYDQKNPEQFIKQLTELNLISDSDKQLLDSFRKPECVQKP